MINPKASLNEEALLVGGKAIPLRDIQLVSICPSTDHWGLVSITFAAFFTALAASYFSVSSREKLGWILLAVTGIIVGFIFAKLALAARESSSSILLTKPWSIQRVGPFTTQNQAEVLAQMLTSKVQDYRRRKSSSPKRDSYHLEDKILVGNSFHISQDYVSIGNTTYPLTSIKNIVRSGSLQGTYLRLWGLALVGGLIYMMLIFAFGPAIFTANSNLTQTIFLVAGIGYLLIISSSHVALFAFVPPIYSVTLHIVPDTQVVYKTHDRSQAYQITKQLKSKLGI